MVLNKLELTPEQSIERIRADLLVRQKIFQNTRRRFMKMIYGVRVGGGVAACLVANYIIWSNLNHRRRTQTDMVNLIMRPRDAQTGVPPNALDEFNPLLTEEMRKSVRKGEEPIYTWH